MANVNDVIRLVDYSTYFGQQCLNVYYFQLGNAVLGNFIDYAARWWENVGPTIRAVQNNGVFHTKVTVENVSSGIDIAEYSIPAAEGNGTRVPASAEQRMSPFVALGVRLSVSTRFTRGGYKRYVGMNEPDWGEYGVGPIAATMQTALNNLVAALPQSVLVSSPAQNSLLIPVIARIGVDGLVAQFNAISGAKAAEALTTQNTRKVGRGS